MATATALLRDTSGSERYTGPRTYQLLVLLTNPRGLMRAACGHPMQLLEVNRAGVRGRRSGRAVPSLVPISRSLGPPRQATLWTLRPAVRRSRVK